MPHCVRRSRQAWAGGVAPRRDTGKGCSIVANTNRRGGVGEVAHGAVNVYQTVSLRSCIQRRAVSFRRLVLEMVGARAFAGQTSARDSASEHRAMVESASGVSHRTYEAKGKPLATAPLCPPLSPPSHTQCSLDLTTTKQCLAATTQASSTHTTDVVARHKHNPPRGTPGGWAAARETPWPAGLG